MPDHKENKYCQACGGSLSREKVNLEDYQGGKLYIMEKVPAMVCEDCGEVWVPEETMHEFEKMINIHRSSRKKRRHGSAQKKGRKKKK